MCEPSLDGKLRPSKAVQETESDILGVIVPYDTPLTKSKALSRLAALQVCSPMYAASPVPLRRRLQAHTSTAAAVESTSGVQTDTDVICIDC